MPVVGGGGGVWSFVHTEDVAAATLAAVERGRGGEIYQVCDDDSGAGARVVVRARRGGRRAPAAAGAGLACASVAGPAVVAMMIEVRGASNAKAKAELGWRPLRPTWRDGFPAVMAGAAA